MSLYNKEECLGIENIHQQIHCSGTVACDVYWNEPTLIVSCTHAVKINIIIIEREVGLSLLFFLIFRIKY